MCIRDRRKAAEDRANAFFTGQIIEEARKKANMTQAELAEKIGTNKSYICLLYTSYIVHGIHRFLYKVGRSPTPRFQICQNMHITDMNTSQGTQVRVYLLSLIHISGKPPRWLQSQNLLEWRTLGRVLSLSLIHIYSFSTYSISFSPSGPQLS